MTPVLSRRASGRATLARQFLLARADGTVPEVVAHLVGLQAQTPHTWYTGLWSRIAGFTPDRAADLLVDRELVRIAVMRSTIHLVTAGRALPAEKPRTNKELGALLHERWPDRAPASPAYAIRCLVRGRPVCHRGTQPRLRARVRGRAAATPQPARREHLHQRTTWCCATWPRSARRR